VLSVIELIDLARERQGGVSSYRIAKLLGINPNSMSNYRSGRSLPANSIAMGLAELAGLDPLETVCMLNLARATTDEDREVWEKLLVRVARTGEAKNAH
jgi:DNA-binding IclR family transcriptional regulator